MNQTQKAHMTSLYRSRLGIVCKNMAKEDSLVHEEGLQNAFDIVETPVCKCKLLNTVLLHCPAIKAVVRQLTYEHEPLVLLAKLSCAAQKRQQQKQAQSTVIHHRDYTS